MCIPFTASALLSASQSYTTPVKGLYRFRRFDGAATSSQFRSTFTVIVGYRHT
jgi:hypothetical protein